MNSSRRPRSIRPKDRRFDRENGRRERQIRDGKLTLTAFTPKPANPNAPPYR